MVQSSCNLHHQNNLIHSFIDVKKTFDRIWQAGLQQVFRSFTIDERLVEAIQAIHEHSSGAVLLNKRLGEFFKITVGVREGYLPLSIHHTYISIGGRPICSIRFADDIDLMGGSKGELQSLTKRFIDRATAYGMEVSTEQQDHDQ